MNSGFYTYLWLRKDGTPYYVGKGTKYRAFVTQYHRVYPPSKDRIRIQEWPDEKIALAMEMYLIDFYGRLDIGTGCLRNRTDGGEGCSGYKHTEKSKQKIRSTVNKEQRKVHLQSVFGMMKKGSKHSEDTKSKMRHTRSHVKKGTVDPLCKWC